MINNIAGVTITKITVHDDSRGSLWKLIQTGFNEKFGFGETYLTLTQQFAWRGGHYHEKMHEWFIVLQGTALFRFYNLDTDEMKEMEVSHDERLRFEIPPRVAHSFKNMGDEILSVLAVATQCYNPMDHDTFCDNKVAFC